MRQKRIRGPVLKREFASQRSADAPDPTSDFHEVLNVKGVAQKPGKDGTAATAKPETTGEFRPTVPSEQIGRWIFDGDVRGGDMGLFAGLVVQEEQQSQKMHCTDGSEQAGRR